MKMRNKTQTFADITAFLGVVGVRGLNTARIRSLTEFQTDRNSNNEMRKAISIKQFEIFKLEDFVDTDEIEDAVNMKQHFKAKLNFPKMELREIQFRLRKLDKAISRSNQLMSEIQINAGNLKEYLRNEI